MDVSPSADRPPFRRSARWRWITIASLTLVLLSVTTGFLTLWWLRTLPDRVDEQQTVLISPERLAPGSNASARVVVQDLSAGRPIAGAQVKVSLQPEKGRARLLYEGQTDEAGSAPVFFHVPADAPPRAQIVVETRSRAGRDRVEQKVTIEREYRILLSTDKPVYQPGQTIHMRALALSTLDMSPAGGANLDFLVEDAKGNKVYRQRVIASDFGIAAADMALADMVNQGDYKLTVSLGGTSSEKTVEVRPYVLPKFAVQIATDRSFYLPGERVEGTVQADYFFGKPVAQGQVQIVGSVWDVARTVAVDLHGQTDEEGAYRFAFDLPPYLAGSGLEAGQAQFALEVTVIDQTDHPEQASQVLPIASQPLIIEAVAESGVLKPGVPNTVYVLIAYPDGRPASAQVLIGVDGSPTTMLASGEFGLAEFVFTPTQGGHTLFVTALEDTGLSAQRMIALTAEESSDSVLLRADRAAYVMGETMHLVALTPVQSGSVYLDVVKAGQTLSTRSAPVQRGSAEFAVDVTPDLGVGTLELHAYKVLVDGTIVRDTRLVVIDAANEVEIAVDADKETYLPGETAAIRLQTGGLQTALGISIVDESVYALQRQDPGFAKLYFMLRQELLEPFYQVKGFVLPASVPLDQQELRQAHDSAAKATWAGAGLASAVQAVNSRPIKLDAAREAQQRGYGRLAVAAVAGLSAVPVLLWGVVLAGLWQARVLKRALVRLLAAFGLVVLIGGCLVGWAIALSRSGFYMDEDVLLIPLGILAGAGVLALLVLPIYALARKDTAAGIAFLLTAAWVAGLLILVLALDQRPSVDEGLLLAVPLSWLPIPAAYILFGQGRWLQSRRLVGTLATSAGMILSPLPILMLFALLSSAASVGAPGAAFAPTAAMREVGVVLEVEKAVDGETNIGPEAQQQAAEAPRLRQYFPETLYWAPELLTDERGELALEVPLADSITTWRLTALASSQDGRLGYTTHGIRVFQDFFVDVDLPVSLTQDDEISIPVGVFNYLPEAQQVRLVVEPESWFELRGTAEHTLNIPANEIEVVYFPIRVREFGQQGFQVTAWGEKMSDAVRRQVRVMPDGKEVRLTESNWLREPRETALDIPAQAVPGTQRVEVKIYPGVMAQVIEGLEKILRLPHG